MKEKQESVQGGGVFGKTVQAEGEKSERETLSEGSTSRKRGKQVAGEEEGGKRGGNFESSDQEIG